MTLILIHRGGDRTVIERVVRVRMKPIGAAYVAAEYSYSLVGKNWHETGHLLQMEVQP